MTEIKKEITLEKRVFIYEYALNTLAVVFAFLAVRREVSVFYLKGPYYVLLYGLYLI